MKSAKQWVISYVVVFLLFLFGAGSITIIVDPYFHYHKPLSGIFYSLDNQRSQNNGIVKHFDYDAIITGSSMAENFKASELDKLFDVHSIKVPFSGGSYKEINDNLEIALKYNSDVVMIVRPLDMTYFFNDKDLMRSELGTYPLYLYDDNIFNDAPYVFNRDILSLSLSLLKNSETEMGGVTDFDHYSYWMRGQIFGKGKVLKDHAPYMNPETANSLTEGDKNIIQGNIEQNVTRLANKYPDVTFYYFFPPYSAAWWGDIYQAGDLDRQIEAEQYIIEMILECKNIKLYSFNDEYDIITDLYNYKAYIHYGEWVNRLILE